MTDAQLVAKEAMRKQLASLSFSEKVKIVEKLRDRSLALAGSGLRQKSSGDAGKTANADTSKHIQQNK